LLGTVAEVETEDGEVVLVCRSGSGQLHVNAGAVETVWPGHFLLVLTDSELERRVPAPLPPEVRIPDEVVRPASRLRRRALLRPPPGLTSALPRTLAAWTRHVPHGRRLPEAGGGAARRLVALARHAVAVLVAVARATGAVAGRVAARLGVGTSVLVIRARRTLAARLLRLARELEP
jgi:hypothetical protein